MSASLGGVLSPSTPWVLCVSTIVGLQDTEQGALGKVGYGDKAACMGQWKQWEGML